MINLNKENIMTENFQKKLANDSFNTSTTANQGDPVGWGASLVTADNKSKGLDFDGNGTITNGEKAATISFFDTYGINTYGEYEKLTTVLDTNNDGNLSQNELNGYAVLNGVFKDDKLKNLTTDQKLNLLQEIALSDNKNGLTADNKTNLTGFLANNQKTDYAGALQEIRDAFGIIIQPSRPQGERNMPKKGGINTNIDLYPDLPSSWSPLYGRTSRT